MDHYCNNIVGVVPLMLLQSLSCSRVECPQLTIMRRLKTAPDFFGHVYSDKSMFLSIIYNKFPICSNQIHMYLHINLFLIVAMYVHACLLPC